MLVIVMDINFVSELYSYLIDGIHSGGIARIKSAWALINNYTLH